MEAAPPSYEKATLVDYLDIVARYIPSSDLCSAALVCSKWHTTFSPHLWGNPASHFGIENDRVYVALTKFKRTLQTARLLVRSQTHTLHLPPAHAEIYNGPHNDWLRDILSRLPNLQSLIVRGLPFFDHGALVALKQPKPPEANASQRDPHSFAVELTGSVGSVFQPPPDALPSFGLRLLDASRCPNVTSSGLAQALRHFESLMYLDLSHTYPARDASVMRALRRFSGLQVLKLRGLSLRDAEMEVLAWAIGRRVRSLDVRDNHITDSGIRSLLDNCFTTHMDGNVNVPNGARSPSLLPYLGAEMLETYQSDGFEGFLRETFTGAFVSRLAIEDAPEGGITHLYISNNKVSVEGASGLIRSQRLHVLDVGTVSGAIERHLSVLDDDDQSKPDWQLPGAEKLTPVLYDHAKDGLTYLKVDNSLITKDVPNTYSDEIVPGRIELGDNALPPMPNGDVFELGGNRTTNEAFELPTDEQTPRYELEADPMQFIVFPAEPEPAPRRGSALAPEVVDDLAEETDTMKLLSPTSPVSEDLEANITSKDSSTLNTVSSIETPSTNITRQSTVRPRSLSSVVTERTARLNAHRSKSHNIHPAMLPHLRTLVITNFPPFSSDKDAVDRLIRFVKSCAQEASLAHAQARLDYALPPGRKGQAATLRHSAGRIFALKRIVLEMAPDRPKDSFGQASPWQHLSTRSMTEDRDSEALWSAAETDFSFFGEEDECAFPSIESGRFANTTAAAGIEVVGNGWTTPTPNSPLKAPEQPRVDNVAILSAFRKERKLAHQRSLAAGVLEPETEGFWDGAIQVVRPVRGFRDGEELDYYGNKFEKNYLYR